MAAWPYSTARWQRLRRLKLIAVPCCEVCEAMGRVTVANTVDHVITVKAGGHPFPAFDGLRSLCASHHNQKTSALDRPDRKPGRGLPRGCDADGKPLDPFTRGGEEGIPDREKYRTVRGQFR